MRTAQLSPLQLDSRCRTYSCRTYICGPAEAMHQDQPGPSGTAAVIGVTVRAPPPRCYHVRVWLHQPLNSAKSTITKRHGSEAQSVHHKPPSQPNDAAPSSSAGIILLFSPCPPWRERPLAPPPCACWQLPPCPCPPWPQLLAKESMGFGGERKGRQQGRRGAVRS